MPHCAALVLFSGGQDSATCLAWALERYERVETIGFQYGQRHAVEMECRPRILRSLRQAFSRWDEKLGEDHVVDLGVLGKLSDTALTRNKAIEFERNGLPSTFVPGRNVMFFTLAAALAYRRELNVLVGGMCETDYSGYPDCRDDTIKALQVALNLGLAQRMVLETPLMWLTKAQTWALGKDLGGEALLSILVEETHSCYMGDRAHRHPWGYGCGECPACELRANGFKQYRLIS
ncbi:MAG: 7-cyano-7-deazaguanine synthase QueC [Burkholderiales bacterium]